MKLRNYVNKPDGSATRQGLYVDDHISSLLTINDEIIALAMIPSDYELDGSMFELHQPFRVFNEQRLRQQSCGCVDTAVFTRIPPPELCETLCLFRTIPLKADISGEFVTDR